MNKAVNTKQFITCRLCLDEVGIYQIVRNVKDQISYCFGIEIEPFDGLPQLICEKCEKLLSNYSEIKKKYIANQAELRIKIFAQEPIVIVPRIELPAEVITDSANTETNKENGKKQTKRKSRISSSSDESNREDSPKHKLKQIINNELLPVFPDNYTKHYICRLCNTPWSNVHLVTKHVQSRHELLYKKFGHIIKKHCHVAMTKIDLGVTGYGFPDKIMVSKDKIVENVKAAYYVTYTTRDYKHDRFQVRTSSGHMNRGKGRMRYISSDSSEDEDTGSRKRRKAIDTTSSNETINLDSKTEVPSDHEKEPSKGDTIPPPSDLGECILLLDSSDESAEETSKPNAAAPKADLAVISEMLATCQKKYIKKHYLDSLSLKSSKDPEEIASQLKRKILSIGRKIISKKIGVNGTPLTRFLENKNLDIVWNARQSAYVNSDSNCVRILARKRHTGDKIDNELGWSDVTQTCNEPPERNSDEPPAPPSGQNAVNGSNGPFNGIQLVPVSMPELQRPFICWDSSVTLDPNTAGAGKLLNANPVANPKQLPRKTPLCDSKNAVSVPDPVPEFSLEAKGDEMVMPIIMSTTSLAVPPEPENNKPDEAKPAEGPRIKVRSASELMSAESLQRMQGGPLSQTLTPVTIQPVSVQSLPTSGVVIVPRVTAGALPKILPKPANLANVEMFLPDQQGFEFLVLNTVELPNKKTNSPFQYFKNLLQLHNLTLLDTHTELNSEFHCLIRFKVMYKQDNTNQPVVLCLALHCDRNIFCFKIRDRNQHNIDLSKITANWQWEVLKIFKGEVVSKLLNSAKKISADQYEYTNKFLCLLKSIDLVR